MKWIAEYIDGKRLFEKEGHGFYDIERDKLKSFKITNNGVTFGYDVSNGIFDINGTPLELKYNELELMSVVNDYTDLIQFKQAYANFHPSNGASMGNRIESYNFGYKTKVDDINYKAIITIPNGGRPYLEVTLTCDEPKQGNIEIDYEGSTRSFVANILENEDGQVTGTKIKFLL